MIKKLLNALLSFAATVTCVFGLTSCGDKDNDNNGNGEILVNGLYLHDDGDGYTVTRVENSYINEAVIPDQYNGKPVIAIGRNAFYYCNSLTNITIPDSVTTISDYAFYLCRSLQSIDLPDSITTIGENVFALCDSLEYNIYGNALYLGNERNPYLVLVGVRDNEDLEDCTVNEKTKVIVNSAFFNCNSLKNLTVEESNVYYHSSGNCIIEIQSKILIAGCKNSVIPTDGSVTSIGDEAFCRRTSLTRIDIPDGVTSIGDSAFYNCSNLTSITIPDSVIEIGDSAFCRCTSLTSITIPNGVEVINSSLFSYCDSLTTVTIPNSVTEIGYSVFSDCRSLTDINFKGTRSEWNAIDKSNTWNSDLRNYTVHCTDGDIAKQ